MGSKRWLYTVPAAVLVVVAGYLLFKPDTSKPSAGPTSTPSVSVAPSPTPTRSVPLGPTRTPSTSHTFAQANRDSYATLLSSEGRFVAFETAATDLGVPYPNHKYRIIVVRDRRTGTNILASTDTAGRQLGANAILDGLSADGQRVLFEAAGSIYLRELSSPKSRRVAAGRIGVLSADGLHVAYLPPSRGRTSAAVTVLDVSTGRARAVGRLGRSTFMTSPPFARYSLSGDGRLVAFVSGDAGDLTKKDGKRPTISVVNIDGHVVRTIEPPQPEWPLEYLAEPKISADGKKVAFTWGDNCEQQLGYPQCSSVYLADMASGKTVAVSVTTKGRPEVGWGTLRELGISSDGRYVSFDSYEPDLVAGDTNTCNAMETGDPVCSDIFVRDVVRGITIRVSVSTTGRQANKSCPSAAISGDGRHVAFTSDSTNLVPNDTNGVIDVFVRDIQTGVTGRVSIAG